MKYVVDSSVAFKWVVPEADTDKAIRLRDAYAQGFHELLAPDVFPLEVGHALTRGERQKRLAVGLAKGSLADIMNASPQLHSSLPLLVQACDISSAHRIGIYDCLYVVLADQEGCEFITADDNLVKNLQKTYPCIVALSSLP